MLFTLEVLKAKHGDSLLLHCGSNDDPQIIVIDGGPAGVFNATLRPRLKEISENFQLETLLLPMVMVSHIDDDHINGIKAMLDLMVSERNAHRPAPYKIDNFWCNSFDDIIGNIQLPKVQGAAANASVASVASMAANILQSKDSHVAAVIASVDQGRKVSKNADFLGLEVNKPFTALKKKNVVMVRGDIGQEPIDVAGIKVTVIHPNAERLEALQEEWDKKLKIAMDKGDETISIATVAEFLVDPDTSPYNLSSIVCLVEASGKKILLTGDARMDDIEKGLQMHNLLENGTLVVDIFKIPHHGSDRNATGSLLQKIKAKHYVISADGKHNNPDQLLLDMLFDNLESGTIHLTYDEGEHDLADKVAAFRDRLINEGSPLTLSIRDTDKPSIIIDLDDPLNY